MESLSSYLPCWLNCKERCWHWFLVTSFKRLEEKANSICVQRRVACFRIHCSTIQCCLINKSVKLHRTRAKEAPRNSGKCLQMSPSLSALSFDQFRVCINMSEKTVLLYPKQTKKKPKTMNNSNNFAYCFLPIQ